MAKRVFLVHGWDGNPDNCWFPWLRRELEAKGFKVFAPAMPDPENPKIETWVQFLKEQVGDIDKDTYFVGHSIGCQAIMRLLEKVKGNVGGIIFVAGWFSLPFLETEEEKETAKPWLDTPIDTGKVRRKTRNIVAIFSDEDPFVSLDEVKIFEERLSAKTIIEKGMGHFDDEAGIKKLDIVLQELLQF